MFSAEILILPRPSHTQTSSLPETFRNTAQNGPPSKFFGTARQKKSTKNREIILLSIKFFHTWNQWHPRGLPYEIFRHCETKTFRQKLLILPPRPSRPQTYSFPETFRNAAQKGSPAMFFGTGRQKKFDKKWWHIPFKHIIFRYPKSV